MPHPRTRRPYPLSKEHWATLNEIELRLSAISLLVEAIEAGLDSADTIDGDAAGALGRLYRRLESPGNSSGPRFRLWTAPR